MTIAIIVIVGLLLLSRSGGFSGLGSIGTTATGPVNLGFNPPGVQGTPIATPLGPAPIDVIGRTPTINLPPGVTQMPMKNPICPAWGCGGPPVPYMGMMTAPINPQQATPVFGTPSANPIAGHPLMVAGILQDLSVA